MAEDRFDIGKAINYAWEAFKDNWIFLVVAFILAGFIQGIPNSLTGALKENLIGLQIILNLVGMVLALFVSMAFIRISLKLVDQERPDWPDLWLSYPKFWYYLAGQILYGLIVLGGLILLIVPGIIWAIKYQFTGYLILDQDMDPVEAIKRSGEMTKGVKGELFLFGLTLFGLNLLGFLACCVGTLVTAPMSAIATAYVYRSLLATEQRVPIPAPASPGTGV